MSIDPATLSYDRDGLVACICRTPPRAWSGCSPGPTARPCARRITKAHARVLEPLALRAVGEGRHQRQHARDRRCERRLVQATRCSTAWCRAAPPATPAARRAGASGAASRGRWRARSWRAATPIPPRPTSRVCSTARASTRRARSARRPPRCCWPSGSDEQMGEVARLRLPRAGAGGARRARPAGGLRRTDPQARGLSRSGEARVRVGEVRLDVGIAPGRAQEPAPRAAARATRRRAPRRRTSAGAARRAARGGTPGSASPSFAQTVSHSSFSFCHVQRRRKWKPSPQRWRITNPSVPPSRSSPRRAASRRGRAGRGPTPSARSARPPGRSRTT